MPDDLGHRPSEGPRRAVVTGAAGFIGGHLVERLASLGWDVIAVDALLDPDRLQEQRWTLEHLASLRTCAVVRADLATDDVRALVDGADVIFHQAGQPGVRPSWAVFDTYVQHNVLATKRLLDAAAEARPRAFVYASSSSVYGSALRYPTDEEEVPRPFSPYGVTKLAAEHLCGVYARNLDLPTVSLRYFTVYGPRQRPDMAMHRSIEAALTGRPFPLFGDGRQVRDFTYVGDVVNANILAATRPVVPGSVFNVAGGTSVSLLDVIALVEDLTGRRVHLDQIGARRGDVHRTGGSTVRAREVLGWKPAVPLREGLAAQVAWHVSAARSTAGSSVAAIT